MLHQVVDILLVHSGVVLVNEQLELRIVHEFIGVEFVHFKEALIVLNHKLGVVIVSIISLLLDSLFLFDALSFFLLV